MSLLILAIVLSSCRPELPPGYGHPCKWDSDCEEGLGCPTSGDIITEPYGLANHCQIECITNDDCRFEGRDCYFCATLGPHDGKDSGEVTHYCAFYGCY